MSLCGNVILSHKLKGCNTIAILLCLLLIKFKYCVFLDSNRGAHHGYDGEDVSCGTAASVVYGLVLVLLGYGG